MENYSKGKNEEEKLGKHHIGIRCLPADFLWMTVNAGSKIRNLLTYALASFPKHKTIVWSGSGPAVTKVVSCAEIMKKKYRNSLHQVTKIGYRTVDEYWDPLVENLDQIVVKRKLPCIHILLTMDVIYNLEKELGYQAPKNTLSRDMEALDMNEPMKVDS